MQMGMALYFDACLEEAGDDAAFIAQALGNIARARGMTQLAKDTGLHARGCTKPCPLTVIPVLRPSLKSLIPFLISIAIGKIAT